MFTILWDVKEPAHLSQRVGHVVPGVVVCPLWFYYRGPCVRKLFTGLIMYYPLKIKNIVLYCIVDLLTTSFFELQTTPVPPLVRRPNLVTTYIKTIHLTCGKYLFVHEFNDNATNKCKIRDHLTYTLN